ncbi:MAG: tetratricopeptide repeat protein [Bacteroidales bacterium]|nr:tetratricopeptide repeat protein [Bacteroidales bacterium]
MNFNDEEHWYDGETMDSVHRYEDMMKNHHRYFFDIHEFENIIDYYLDIENLTQAAQVADYASHLYPSSSSIQFRMAEIMIDNGQPTKALALLNELEKLETGEYTVHLLKGAALNVLGKAREAQRQFEKAIALADEDKAQVLYDIGVSFERINQYKMALQYFLKVRAIEPDNYYIYYDLAFCCDRINDLDSSIAYYKKYLDEDPFAEYAWYNLGIVYNRKEDDEKAIEAYDYALAIYPEYTSALFNKANTLTLLNKTEEAIETYNDFLRIEPDNAAVHCYLGECHEKNHDYDCATQYFQKSLSLDNTFADAWFGMGIMNADCGRFEESVRCLKHAIALDKDNEEYLFGLATTYINLQQFDKANVLLDGLLQKTTDDEVMWCMYAHTFAQQEQYADAQRITTKGLQYNPDSALLRYHLAAYYLLNDDRLKGLTILEESLRKHPEDVDIFFEVFDREDNLNDEVMALVNAYRKNP